MTYIFFSYDSKHITGFDHVIPVQTSKVNWFIADELNWMLFNSQNEDCCIIYHWLIINIVVVDSHYIQPAAEEQNTFYLCDASIMCKTLGPILLSTIIIFMLIRLKLN